MGTRGTLPRLVRATTAAAVLTALLASGCAAGGAKAHIVEPTAVPTYTPTSTGAPARAPQWLLSAGALKLLGDAGMSPAQLSAVFDSPRTYLIRSGAGNPDPEPGWQSRRTISFTSFAAMSTALGGTSVDPHVGAVLYDDENWTLTPSDEQHDPARFEQQAATLAHAHHLLLIATPATDLTRVLAPGEASYAAYLRLNIAGDAARYADVIDIQAQGSESSVTEFADFVGRATAQARAANPRVVVLAGISTNPTGHHITAAQLQAAVTATSGTVDGYWLNIPAEGPACPSCGQPQPQVAADMLRALYPSPGT